jgi:D-psicose/D-tagatose/L-ribulose 3-epimerase
MIRLSISNIAWEISEDEEIACLLKSLGVDAIDIAPSKYFPVVSEVSSKQLADLRATWNLRGFDIVGMQSLLFGQKGLNVFGPREQQELLLEHLRHMCRIGCGLGATRLVFGSPRNRDASGLSQSVAEQVALDFFNRLGALASDEGVTVCIEANPPSYGCNFLVTTSEALSFVQKLNHPSIKLQIDTGTVLVSNESLRDFFDLAPGIIGHIHISEPELVPAGDKPSGLGDHVRLLASLPSDDVATIEMLATLTEPHTVSVERAVRWVHSQASHEEYSL